METKENTFLCVKRTYLKITNIFPTYHFPFVKCLPFECYLFKIKSCNFPVILLNFLKILVCFLI